MSKPILIIRIPIIEKELYREKLVNEIKCLQKEITDYHIITLLENSIESIQFECFNVLEKDNLDLEILKKEVEDKWKLLGYLK
jgi:hypothetical protein